MTQLQKLKAHLSKGKSITPLQAWKMYGIYRLSARVADLRETMNIKTKIVCSGKSHFAKYYI